MKSLKKQFRFFVTTFLAGITTLLAGSLNLAQAQIGAPATDMRAAPAASKQQVTPASPAPRKVVVTASGVVATVTYLELLKISSAFEDGRQTYGKTLQVAVNGKGDLGYFLKESDAITFVCDSGDKAVTANRTFKGTIQGVIYKYTPWEGTNVYSMKKCQIVK